MQPSNQNNASVAQKVTLIGMFVDIILGAVKLLVGGLSNSHALVADGIHSLSDAATDVFVIIITRASHHRPDANHPYGHARFETIGTLLLGSSLIAIGLLLAYNYIDIIFTDKTTLTPSWPALLVALTSIASKEWIFRYTKKAGEQLRSNLLIANAWHSRTDAFSSVIVLVGVTGSMAGIHWLDSVAAVFIAFIVLKVGGQLVWDSSKELVDTGLEPEQVAALRTTLRTIEGILDVHDLRTRRMGQDVLLDVHLQVSPAISVSEGHQIGEWATQELLKHHTYISDVIYHVDAENDHDHKLQSSNALLPLRDEVITALCGHYSKMPAIERCVLHYLGNKVNVELFINNTDKPNISAAELQQQLLNHNQHVDWLGSIHVWYHD